MLERFMAVARTGVHAVVVFFAGVGGHIADWARSGDLTVLVLLAVAAILLLFAFVPNRRRY